MSFLSEQNVQCETIQDALENEFVNCPVPYEAMPFMEALLSTQKAAGISQSVSDGGKVKNVKVVYEQRALESAATQTTGARTCTSTNETFNRYQTYTIDPTTKLEYTEKLDVADYATICVDFAGALTKKIAKVIDVLERKQATITSTALVSLYGEWGTNVSGTVTNDELVVAAYISAATKAIDFTSMSTIDLALMQTGYCAPAIIVGGSQLYQYGQFTNAGCCAEAGVDVATLAAQFGKAILFDKRVATALGSQAKSIVFQAGSLALITYNEFDETNLIKGTNYTKMKVFSPRTGLPVDIILKDECGVISIVGYLTAKLVGLPADMFAAGDEFAGVTYVNKILVTNPA